MESGRSRLMFSSLAVTTQMLKILADDVNLGLLSIGGGAGWLAFDVLNIYIFIPTAGRMVWYVFVSDWPLLCYLAWIRHYAVISNWIHWSKWHSYRLTFLALGYPSAAFGIFRDRS